jgi:hypothetical protein
VLGTGIKEEERDRKRRKQEIIGKEKDKDRVHIGKREDLLLWDKF